MGDEPKHTPGPWVVDDDRRHTNGAAGFYVSINGGNWWGLAEVPVRMCGEPEDDPVGLANAALIASAPDMAAEIERLRADNARLREVHTENARLLGLVAHDLIGRVEGGKVAAIQQCAERARAALSGEAQRDAD